MNTLDLDAKHFSVAMIVKSITGDSNKYQGLKIGMQVSQVTLATKKNNYTDNMPQRLLTL